jgi:hypothetical protein
VPIPDQSRTNNLQGTRILTRLGLHFDQVGTSSVMTHVLVLSAKMGNEQLWHTLDIGNMFGPTFGLKNSQYFNLRNEITNKFVVLMISIFLHGKNLHRLLILEIWHNI